MSIGALQEYIDFKNNIAALAADMTPEKIEAIGNKIQTQRSDGRELLTIDESGNAHINIIGPLEPKADPCAIMFDIDMTTYSDIITAAIQAQNNPNVLGEVIFHFDTPGGNVVGAEKTANVIKDITKPTRAIIHGECCSAGLILASQCDIFESEGETQLTGSLGVRTTMIDRSEQDRQNGITRHIIVSENAPNKALDPASEADRLKLKAFITKIESVFINFVASGRNTTPEFVRENFGKGAVLIARDALAVGMIDKIQTELTEDSILIRQKNTNSAENLKTGESDMGEITMSEEDFQAKIDAAATSAAEKTATKINSDFEAKEKVRIAEDKRKAGFTTLKNKFPEMSSMIDEEMGKPEANADLDFGLKVTDADNARIVAAAEQKKNADGKTGTVKPDGDAGTEKDDSGNRLAVSLGLKVGA